MADALAIITGIFAIIFLLYYLAFNLNKEHDFLKLILVISGLFLLLFIPGQLKETDRDCGITNDGSYVCYYTNGSRVTNFGEGNNVGGDVFRAIILLLRIIMVYAIAYIGYKLLKGLGWLDKWINNYKKRFR